MLLCKAHPQNPLIFLRREEPLNGKHESYSEVIVGVRKK
jgi:hypothetical protein